MIWLLSGNGLVLQEQQFRLAAVVCLVGGVGIHKQPNLPAIPV
jgi:predicted small integral membrane protein